jgi:signal transduction histidine kinase
MKMGIDVLSAGHATNARPDLFWAWITLGLSSMVAIGYTAIAFNWYFQIKVASQQSKAALTRLMWISMGCALCGAAFYASDVAWSYLRLCDVAIAGLAIYTWTFVLRMRGLSLVDQRLAEIDELEARAERYREIAQLLPHLVWTATGDGQIDFSNKCWIDFAGDTRPWLTAVHPDDQDRVNRWWHDAHRAVRPATIEAKLCGTRGVCRTFLISATPVIHPRGVKWLGACADIEDQKLLAAQREEQSRQKSFFLNALSHDLRTPLNAVVLHAELLRCSALDGDAAESARAITESATAASELINRLLDFARVGSLDRNVIDRVSLMQVLQQIYQRYLPLAAQRELYLRVSDDTDVEIHTDRHKLERILGNLIDNAIKYTTHGGVAVSIEHSNDVVTFGIHDTGIGVPADKAAHLFDEFYQVQNEARDRRQGFGLGLAICRSLAHQLGGEVRLARSGPNGSCFECTVRDLVISAAHGQDDAPAIPDFLNANQAESLHA